MSLIDIGVTFGFLVRHISQRAGRLRRSPGRVVQSDAAGMDCQAGVLGRRVVGMLLDALHRGQIGVNLIPPDLQPRLNPSQGVQIVFYLRAQRHARLLGQMQVVAPLDEILDLHRDQQADSDREEMKQELGESTDGLMRQMNVEHGRATSSEIIRIPFQFRRKSGQTPYITNHPTLIRQPAAALPQARMRPAPAPPWLLPARRAIAMRSTTAARTGRLACRRSQDC